MGSEVDKLYEEIERLNKRIAELEHDSSGRADDSSGGFDTVHGLGIIPEQESFILDSHSVGGYRNLSLPNGGVMKVKVLPFCKNGSHVVKNIDDIIFCSRCGGVICKEHMFDISPPLCRECVEKELGELDYKDVALLFAVKNNLGVGYLTSVLKLSRSEIDEAAANCLSRGYLKRSFFNFLFSGYQTTFEGERIIHMASLIYDLPNQDNERGG
ncbi:MAG: hypothetical protein QXU98_07750 [Candidatus Parvarchaeota archaeon]